MKRTPNNMPEKQARKLTLHRETLRVLNTRLEGEMELGPGTYISCDTHCKTCKK
ncbi:MAG TPA: hypothetical protein VFA07_01455 [Chthonomonadaceae bacterium]|nr:hypothetical protein [Chthonomonadaceae bacterium]